MFHLSSAYFAMIVIVTASNYLVLFPINDWLTWGSFSYPIAFFVTELTNRTFGPKKARQVVYVGFALAVFLSIWLATPKIALASGSAFLCSQMLDIYVFNRLRRSTWWIAPFSASVTASFIDAAIFWNMAFYGEQLPVLTWAIGDTSVKLLLDVIMLTPFRAAISCLPPPTTAYSDLQEEQVEVNPVY
jgi:uncharacterized PurR-regulated membrane protein YhhQ (DUF165 family)